MTATRRLAAIMFTDMVGSTASAQANEAEALWLRDEQAGLVRPLFAEHQGREIKSMGDGFLAEFDSALRAVQCAIDIQQRLHERNSLPGRSPIQLRIGVHLGDVEEREADIFGDAVNIAARIEPRASPGGICLSGKVYSQVRNKIPNALQKLPPAALKGVKVSIDVYRVVLPWTDGGGDGPAAPTGIAILPFTNIGPDPNDEYFADGLTEELISVISQVRELRVISRTSVMQYKATSKPISQIGSELGVASVLEGSVRRAGNRLRITAQLIDARSDRHLWAKTYERELNDVFAIQTEIAEMTAGALRIELLGAEKESIKKRTTVNVTAYNLYLKGIHAAHHPHVFEGVTEAIHYFEEAIQLDPTFPAPYSYLANMYIGLAGVTLGPAESFPRAKQLIEKALELDPDSSEALCALGNYTLQREQDWAAAEREFQRAITLNPSNAMAHWWYAILLGILQRFPEARVQIETTLELDPLWESPKLGLISLLMATGSPTSAIAMAQEEVDTHPEDPPRHLGLAALYLFQGRADDARKEVALSVGPLPIGGGASRAIISAVLGDPREARQVLAEREEASGDRYVSPLGRAELYAAVGEYEKAFELLERDITAGERFFPFHYQSIAFDKIRNDPRFESLVRKYHLPPGAKGIRGGAAPT